MKSWSGFLFGLFNAFFFTGTSTGSLIAFALVGGNKDPDAEGNRMPMSVTEIIQLYKDEIPKLFRSSVMRFMGFPYSRESFKEKMNDIFGDTVVTKIQYNKCFAGAVAREYNENYEKPDVMKIFDPMASDACRVREVLLGTSDAPLYFDIPSYIDDNPFIDGGVGGK